MGWGGAGLGTTWPAHLLTGHVGSGAAAFLVHPSTWFPHPRPNANSLQPVEPFPIQTLPPKHTVFPPWLPFLLFLHPPDSKSRERDTIEAGLLTPSARLGHSGMTHTGAAAPQHSPPPLPHTQGNRVTNSTGVLSPRKTLTLLQPQHTYSKNRHAEEGTAISQVLAWRRPLPVQSRLKGTKSLLHPQWGWGRGVVSGCLSESKPQVLEDQRF